MNVDCPFCHVTSRIIASNTHAIAIRDAYPVSPGHTLIISRRHCADFFLLGEEELVDCFRLLKQQKEQLDQSIHPQGYNIGINVGESAGQSVFHVHIHLIPRFMGDHPSPRGGVRHIIPEKGDY